MSNPVFLNEDERDCLQELMNVSYGEATAAIASIIDRYATLAIPKINTITLSELKEHLNNKLLHNDSLYIASQIIHGNISGENLFVIDDKSSYNLTKEFGLEDDEIDDDEIAEVVLEITNIISSVTSGNLASMINANITFASPHLNKINSINQFEDRFEQDYENVIIISTELRFEDENIKGELIILTKSDSSVFLKNSLISFIEDVGA